MQQREEWAMDLFQRKNIKVRMDKIILMITDLVILVHPLISK
jgi:hypothetical protein